jgi:hypothetical protein
MKIAKYRTLAKYPVEVILKYSEYNETDASIKRISEVVDVEFKPLPVTSVYTEKEVNINPVDSTVTPDELSWYMSKKYHVYMTTIPSAKTGWIVTNRFDPAITKLRNK